MKLGLLCVKLIDFSSHHSLLTRHWWASASDDVWHWRRLEPFREYSDEA